MMYWHVVFLCDEVFFFFVKQKTEYEMRISDWSSDVCSSDLEEVADVETLFAKGLERKPRLLALKRTRALIKGQQGEYAGRIAEAREAIVETPLQILSVVRDRVERAALAQIGRASCRERVCQYG